MSSINPKLSSSNNYKPVQITRKIQNKLLNKMSQFHKIKIIDLIAKKKIDETINFFIKDFARTIMYLLPSSKKVPLMIYDTNEKDW